MVFIAPNKFQSTHIRSSHQTSHALNHIFLSLLGGLLDHLIAHLGHSIFWLVLVLLGVNLVDDFSSVFGFQFHDFCFGGLILVTLVGGINGGLVGSVLVGGVGLVQRLFVGGGVLVGRVGLVQGLAGNMVNILAGLGGVSGGVGGVIVILVEIFLGD